jgi:integrase
LDKPLKESAEDADVVAKRHDRITEEAGPYAANGAMRTLRAIYNHARKKNKKALPADNPVDAVDWNEEKRRNTAMGLKDLPGWFAELAAMENPIRREFHLFTLLSGCRPTALKNAGVAHLDLQRRVLHIASPKGGEERAFDIPLSRQMIACLVRVVRYGRSTHPIESQTWLFPAESKSGHLAESKEDRDDLSKWGNDLRQTFRTLATIAKVSPVDAKRSRNN